MFRAIFWVFAITLIFFMPDDAEGGERVSLSYAYTDDGGCPKAGHTVQGTYVHESDSMDVYGSVRSAPSGGDCRVDSLSYTVEVERRWEVWNGWDAMVKFGADEHSTSAPYAITSSEGIVLTRPDGMASDPVTLPAGARETIVGVFGASREWNGLRVGVGFNVVPVDWSDGSSGRSLHMDMGYSVSPPQGTVTFDLSADAGSGVFGDFRASYLLPTVGGLDIDVSVTHAFGLNELDGGEPGTAVFAGLPAVLAGSPQDTATVFSVGLSMDI